MHIGVIGYGTVGSAIGQHLKELGHKISAVDPDKGHRDSLEDTDVVFICVNAPTQANGQVDLLNLHDAIEQVPENIPAIIKTTIPMGTMNFLRAQYAKELFFSPEFLQQRKPMENLRMLPVIIDDAIKTSLASAIYKDHQYHLYPVEVCEALKYFTNSFFAAKITFANIWYEICQRKGINYHDVYDSLYDLVGDSGSISMEGLQVPGPDRKFGYGGKCIPKDLASLQSQTMEFFFQYIMWENQRLRAKPSFKV